MFPALWLGWVLFFLLVWNSLPILFFPVTAGFVIERPHVPAAWLPVLQLHILGGVVCLLSGVALVFPLGLASRWHQRIGWIYVASGLGLAVPTGAWLSGYAHGGPLGVMGFRITALWLGLTTLAALVFLRKGDWDRHRRWMMRSYGAAAAALTFRLVYVCGIRLGIPYEVNYPSSTWAAVLLNGIGVEMFLFAKRPR
jgi:uncharacterized membrane protein